MLTHSNRKTVGIMISPNQAELPFTGQCFFARLCVLGAKWGLLVFVFSPLDVDEKSATVQGYRYQASNWLKETFPLPDLIYDRAFFNNLPQYQQHLSAIDHLQQLKMIPYLGRTLHGKWIVHQVMMKHPSLAAHLPHTELLKQPAQLFRSIKEHTSVLIKPVTGSQGKGVFVVTKTADHKISIRGRMMSNRSIVKHFSNPFELYQWLLGFMGRRSYLLQRYLSLQTDQGNAYDIRVLMQKDNQGLWTQTGMAARIGQSTSITSNLHGGGKGAYVYPLLAKQFGSDRAKATIATINQLSSVIPPHLEQHFGRLAELGLDIGIDQSGAAWIIEVNSKPGRAVARWFTPPKSLDDAISKPMQYAHYLLYESTNLGTILGG
ncbi:MAG: YheC/YheD family protein [Paenibacillaceae bacterium]